MRCAYLWAAAFRIPTYQQDVEHRIPIAKVPRKAHSHRWLLSFFICCWFVLVRRREHDKEERTLTRVGRRQQESLTTYLKHCRLIDLVMGFLCQPIVRATSCEAMRMNCLKGYCSPFRVVITPSGTSFQLPGIAITPLGQPSWYGTSFRIPGNTDTVQLSPTYRFRSGACPWYFNTKFRVHCDLQACTRRSRHAMVTRSTLS